jgi:hypothetical protein
MKTPKEIFAEAREDGYRAEVCRGWEAAWDVIRAYIGEKNE